MFQLARCQKCGRLKLASNMTVTTPLGLPPMFCEGDSCVGVECMYCGHMINPWKHSRNECAKLRALCDMRTQPLSPLDPDEAIFEAEMILREAREVNDE